jgi:hypothetical protein
MSWCYQNGYKDEFIETKETLCKYLTKHYEATRESITVDNKTIQKRGYKITKQKLNK